MLICKGRTKSETLYALRRFEECVQIPDNICNTVRNFLPDSKQSIPSLKKNASQSFYRIDDAKVCTLEEFV